MVARNRITSILPILFASLAIFCHCATAELPDMTPAARQVLELFNKTNVVFLGEKHWVAEDKDLLAKILTENEKSHTFDTWATESVFADDQSQVDAYIRDGDPAFFTKMARKMGWFKSRPIRKIYRELHENKSVKVCAIDVPEDWVNGVKLNREERRELFKTRFLQLPKTVQAIMLRLFGDSQEKLFESDSTADREYLLAESILRCIKSGHKILVHTGQAHTASVENHFLRQYEHPDWWWTTQWLKLLDPEVKFLVVHNSIETSSDDVKAKTYQDYFASVGAKAPFLIQSSDLPQTVKDKEVSYDEGEKKNTEDWSQADYWTIGPLGHVDPKLKPPY